VRVQVLAMLTELRRRGVPIDGVGMQMHINNRLKNKVWSAAQFRAVLRQFARIGLEVHLTELDVIPTDPTLAETDSPAQGAQALSSIFAGVFTVCLEFPKTCKLISTWGFTDGYNRWVARGQPPLSAPGAFLFDENDQPKPARKAVAAVLAAHRTGHG
jgi:endo-1,4-beta-xylanase